MGLITRNRIHAYINGVLDLFPPIGIGFNVANLSYFLGNKRNNSIFFL